LNRVARVAATLLLAAMTVCGGRKPRKDAPLPPPVVLPPPTIPQPSPGSLYTPAGRLADPARDPRASQLHDLITIIVSDSASAVTTGATNTSRKSSVASAITSLGGVTRATGPLANLANTAYNQQLQGAGTTSRTNTLSTTLSAEVTGVTANGVLIIEGRKVITVNGEKQVVLVRGIIRPDDVSPANTVTSAQITGLEVSVNGRGVVNDAVHRPFILYRLLLGLLPF